MGTLLVVLILMSVPKVLINAQNMRLALILMADILVNVRETGSGTDLSAQCAQATNAGITIMILRPVLLFKTRLARFLSVDLTELLLLLITIFSESALVKKTIKYGEALINHRGRLETTNGRSQLVSETLVLLQKLTVTTLFSPSGSQLLRRTALDLVLWPLTRNTNSITSQPSKLDLSPWEFPSPAHFREQSRSHLAYDFEDASITDSFSGVSSLNQAFYMTLNNGDGVSFVLGATLPVTVGWDIQGVEGISLYFQGCTVSHGSSSIAVIKDSCYSETLNAEPRASEGLTTSFSFRVFKGKGESALSQTIQCSVVICKDDDGTCGPISENADCPPDSGYNYYAKQD